jgi:hypothetical protein
MMVLGQHKEAGIVGDQMQAIELEAKIPPDPPFARRALPRRGAKAQQRQPLLLPSSDVPYGVADLGHKSQVVMVVQECFKALLLSYDHRAHDDFAKIQLPELCVQCVCGALYQSQAAKSTNQVNFLIL